MRDRPLLLLFVVLLAGCAAGTSIDADGSVVAPGADAAGVPDASVVADAAAPSDASPPDAAPPVLGLSWPASQEFPSFAPIVSLDVIEAAGRPSDVLAMLVTLQGVVNRTQPRIYIPEGPGADMLWLDELAVPSTTVTDPFALVAKYRAELAGVVIVDPAQPDTLNLATTIAGLEDAIVVSPALAATLSAAPYTLPVIADLRANHFSSNLEVYQYELDHYAAAASHRLIIGLTPGIVDHLRDYAVATRALTVWLDPRIDAEKQLLSQFLALLPPNSPYLGWWTDEPAGVHLASTFGVPVYAADWSSNLTVLGGSARGSAPVPPAPPPPPLENKVYVAIFMSDGDNLQEDQHLIPLKWGHGHRGAVPIGWTVSPALVDVAPVILRYFQRTATVNDVLVSGPSGLGYTYPAAWPAGVFEQYTVLSGAYMAAAGLRVATVWNNGADLSDADAHAYVQHVPGLLGLTIQDAPQALRMIDGHVPLLRMALSYGDSAAILESGIDSQLPAFTGSAPLFLAVQGNMNMGPINPDTLYDVQQHYAANTNVVFVRADHLFQLLNAAQHPPAHELLDGDWNGDGKADLGFYYAGNGDWWMGLSSGSAIVWHRAVTTMIGGAHAIHTGDFDGDGKTDVLVYAAADDSWRIGLSDGNALTWHATGAGGGVASVLDGKHRVSVGDYTGDGKADVLVYHSGDGSWRLGVSSGAALSWHVAAQTGGFGNLLDGSHALYDGDWNGDGKRDVLFAYNGDGNWWMGLSDGNALAWHLAGNTSGFGNLIDRSHRVLVGDWNGDHRTDLMFHYNGDGNWWMGLSDGNALAWHAAATTGGYGDLLDWGHRLWVGDHDGDGKSDVFAYDSASGTWWLGRSDGAALAWAALDATAGFGDLVDPSRRLSFGDYDGDGKTDALFHYNGDGNWWLRPASGAPLSWHLAGNTSGFGDILH